MRVAAGRLHAARCFSILFVIKLEDKVMYARGVGPKLAEVIAAKGIVTMEDLLYHLPFRYEDRQNPRPAFPGWCGNLYVKCGAPRTCW